MTLIFFFFGGGGGSLEISLQFNTLCEHVMTNVDSLSFNLSSKTDILKCTQYSHVLVAGGTNYST